MSEIIQELSEGTLERLASMQIEAINQVTDVLSQNSLLDIELVETGLQVANEMAHTEILRRAQVS